MLACDASTFIRSPQHWSCSSGVYEELRSRGVVREWNGDSYDDDVRSIHTPSKCILTKFLVLLSLLGYYLKPFPLPKSLNLKPERMTMAICEWKWLSCV
jgi:hypothetical protein